MTVGPGQRVWAKLGEGHGITASGSLVSVRDGYSIGVWKVMEISRLFRSEWVACWCGEVTKRPIPRSFPFISANSSMESTGFWDN